MIDLNFTPSPASVFLGLLIFGLVIFVLATGAIFGKEMLDQNRGQAQVKEALEVAKVDGMNQRQFRDFVAELLRKQGYAVEPSDAGARDAASSLVATKGDRCLAVLTMHYTKPISAPTIGEALSAQARQRCGGAMVVTNSTFAQAARDLAAARGCELVDQVTLARWIETHVLGLSAAGPTYPPPAP